MKPTTLNFALVALAGTMFASMYLNAQRPRFADGATGTTSTTVAPPIDAAKTYLGLTDSQITGFDAIRQTARTAADPIIEQLRPKEQALREAMRATPVDATKIAAIQTEINALHTQLEKIESDSRAQMVATLSAAQKAKFANLEAAVALREQVQGASMLGLLEGGPGGRGGPGGPGGGKGKDKGKGKGFGGPR
jgi:Spy/CpxP family protein refolding chaperone